MLCECNEVDALLPSNVVIARNHTDAEFSILFHIFTKHLNTNTSKCFLVINTD